MTYLYIHHF